MPKPIDSENVIAWLNAQIEKVQGGWLHDYGFPTNVIAALTDVKCFVKNLPTIAPEVRHGRWIEENPKDSKHCRLVRCSECGFTVCLSMNVPLADWAEDRCYCQKCGARMDGGDDNG